jgi:hypothetical protein
VGAIGDLDRALGPLEGELLKRCSKIPSLQRMLVKLRLLDGQYQRTRIRPLGLGLGPRRRLSELVQERDDQSALQAVTLQIRLDRVTTSVADERPHGNLRRSRWRNLILELDRGTGKVGLDPLRVPNEKRVWDAVVVDGVYGETFGQ